MISSQRLVTASALFRVCLAAFMGATWVGGLAYADAPTTSVKAEPQQIAKLVRELGHERFATREAASDRLARIGLPAFAALEEASRADDREVRFRAEQILNLIRKNDLERRLAAFVAGTATDDYELPAWNRFQKAYGDTEVSRRMFVDMQRADPELLSSLQRDPRAAVEVLGRRLQDRFVAPVRGVTQNLAPVSAGELSAFLFVAAGEDAPVSASSLQLLLQLCRQPAFAETLRSQREGALAKKMLGSVIRRCDGEATVHAIRLAMDLELKEGLEPALKALDPNGKWNAASGATTLTALACVATQGDASHVPAVEKLLDNQTPITTSMVRVIQNNQPTTITKEMQVRDAALAALVMLTRQEMKNYYDEAANARISSSPLQMFQPQIIGFSANAPEKREAALKKWAEYKARQKPEDEPIKPASAPTPPEKSSP